METIGQMKRPSKIEMQVAAKSYNALTEVIEQITKEQTEIEIEETKEKIIIPSRALKLLGEILKAMAQGNPISIVPIAAEVTTQQAAEMIGCSRPFLVKLLEEGKIEFTKVGRHRRIMFDDIVKYKKIMKEAQKKHIIDIMNFDEEIGMYDS